MPVQQHPIPQNITSYQFRLVGDMTLKQFLQLTTGVVIGFIFYATPLPFFFKWPLIALSAGTGAAIAFLPVQGRPLDQWILAFIRSIYAPTIYTWQKPLSATPSTQNQTPTTPASPNNSPTHPATPVTNTISSPQPGTTSTTHPITSATGVTPTITTPPQPSTLKIETPIAPITSLPQLTQQSEPITNISPIQRPSSGVSSIPQSTPISIERQNHQASTTIISNTEAVNLTAPSASITPPTQPGLTASFSTNLPIPHTPTIPNIIVGMTLDNQGKILDSTIIEILKNGQTIRATKSNKLGQFLFAKPLENDLYQITADKEGHTFPRFDLKLEGKITPPIRLQATG